MQWFLFFMAFAVHHLHWTYYEFSVTLWEFGFLWIPSLVDASLCFYLEWWKLSFLTEIRPLTGLLCCRWLDAALYLAQRQIRSCVKMFFEVELVLHHAYVCDHVKFENYYYFFLNKLDIFLIYLKKPAFRSYLKVDLNKAIFFLRFKTGCAT